MRDETNNYRMGHSVIRAGWMLSHGVRGHHGFGRFFEGLVKMRNVSIKRLVTVMVATTIAVVSPAMQQAFAQPMPQEAGLEEIASRIKFASLMSVNALIPALVGAMMGFFTRADRTEPAFALARKDGE